MDADGTLTTVAGISETAGYTNDGFFATFAGVNPWGMTFDQAGNLYIADRFNSRIRKVDADGFISTVVGNGERGYSGDGGPATEATLNQPEDVEIDSFGNLYIADSDNNVIRKVDASGTISTIAGNNTLGESGDGGPATSVALLSPNAIYFDSQNNLYIADNHWI